jgi:hypothetical protein
MPLLQHSVAMSAFDRMRTLADLRTIFLSSRRARSGYVSMVAKSILSELLASIAPGAICTDCIADRVPIHYKANIH